MSQELLVWIPSVFYGVALLWLLYKILRSPGEETARTEALGTKPFGLALVSMTLIATVIGPADTIGLADQGRKYGFFFLLFPLLAAAQHLINGIFFADKIKSEAKDCLTIGDIIGKYYNKPAQILAGVIVLIQALAFTGVLCLAAGQIFQSFFGLPIGYGIVMTAVFVGIYTSMGGMNAVVQTDKVQFAVLALLGVIAVISAILLMLRSDVPLPANSFWRPDFNEFNTSTIIATATAYFLGEALLPVYAVRGLISRTEQVAKRAFKITALGIAIWYFAMTFIGIASLKIAGSAEGMRGALLDVMVNISATPWVSNLALGIALAGLLGIIHSTLDSVLNVGAVSFSRDILSRVFPLSDKEQRTYIQTAVVLIAVLGTIFSVTSETVIEALLVGYTIWVPTLVVPLGYALLYKEKIRVKYSAFIGVITGILGFILGTYMGLPFLPPILTGFITNLIGFLATERLASPSQATPASAS